MEVDLAGYQDIADLFFIQILNKVLWWKYVTKLAAPDVLLL
jgi:hypothetical protein